MNKKGQENIGAIISVLLFLMFIISIFLIWALSIVQYNEYAYENEFGKLKTELKQPGIRWVGFGSLERVNNQVRSYNIKVDSASKDMQDVFFDVNLNIRLKENQSFNFIKNYPNEETFQLYLNNKIQEKSKTIIYKYSAEEVLPNRIEISKEILEELKQLPELQYFSINDVALSNIDFSDEFRIVLERKAQLTIEKDIIIKQKENLALQTLNINEIDVDKYFKYQLIEKWDGKSSLIISNDIITTVK